MLYCNLIVFLYFLTHACCSAGMHNVHPAESKGAMRRLEVKLSPIMDFASATMPKKSKDEKEPVKRYQIQTPTVLRESNLVPTSSPPPTPSPLDVPMQLIDSLLKTVQLTTKENKAQNLVDIINAMHTKLEDIKAKYGQPVSAKTTQAPPKDIVNEMDKLMEDFLRTTGSSGSDEPEAPVMRGEDKEDDSDVDLNYELDEDLKLSLSP